MNTNSITGLAVAALSAAFAGTISAQTVSIFPSDYTAVAEGPAVSQNFPLALGTSRVMCVYETADLTIPVGDQITRLGFREDADSFSTDMGVSLQLEVRMGWTTNGALSMSSTFDMNYDGAFTSVFGPALFTLPDLRDPNNPLPNGQFFLPLSTPFDYTPNGRNLLVEYRVLGTSNGGAATTYRLDRAMFYSPLTYGPAGCQHSGGQIADQILDPIAPGYYWYSTTTQAPANAPAFLAINLSPMVAPYPLAPILPGVQASCTLQLAPTGTSLYGSATSSSGYVQWSFLVPNDVQFSGASITSQTLFLDFFSPGQVVVSNGAEVVVGTRPRSTILFASGPPSLQATGSLNTNFCPVAFFEHQ